MIIRVAIIVIDEPTEYGDTEIYLLTNLPKPKFSTFVVADAYRHSWTVENAFQKLERALESEIRTLEYPKAAQLAHCLALVTYHFTY